MASGPDAPAGFRPPPAVPPDPAVRRRELRKGWTVIAVLVVLAALLNHVYPSRGSMRRAVKGVSVENADRPVAVHGFGSRFPFPMQWMLSQELVYRRPAGLDPKADLRQHWEQALSRDGWTQHHGERFEFGEQPWGWWTKGRFAVALTLKSDGTKGAYFDWAGGEIIVEVAEHGDVKGQIPGPH